jgi:hypothetical protein
MKRMIAMLIAGVALASCAKVSNEMVVTNNSGITAQEVAVTVCGERHVFTNIPDAGTKTEHFTVKHDSGFQVNVRLADGTSMATNFGYVTGGGAYGNHAEIEITKDRQIIGRQK